MALVASGALVTRVRQEFVPSDDRSELSVNVELPTGTSLKTSQQVVAAVADGMRAAREIDSLLGNTGRE